MTWDDVKEGDVVFYSYKSIATGSHLFIAKVAHTDKNVVQLRDLWCEGGGRMAEKDVTVNDRYTLIGILAVDNMLLDYEQIAKERYPEYFL